MKRIFFFWLFTGVYFIASSQTDEQIAPVLQIDLKSDTIFWQIPGLNLGKMMKFSEMNEKGSFNNDVEKEQRYSFIFSTEGWKKEFVTSNSNKLVFPISFRKDGAVKNLNLVFWPDLSHAQFDELYITQNNGKLFLEIPETYELCYTALCLATDQRASNYGVNVNSDYYKEIKNHFSTFESHPLIDNLKAALNSQGNSAFFSVCMDSYSYYFDNSGLLLRKEHYKNFANRLSFGQDVALWQDFAKVSSYHEFYKNHKEFYQNIIDASSLSLDFNNVWKWFEKNLDTKINDYRFVISPLANYFYRKKDLTQNKFAESILFGHSFDKSGFKNISQPAAQLLYLSSYFTATAKTYLKKTIAIDSARIAKVFSDYDSWAEIGKDAFNYQNGYELFTEYMAQSMFLLYIKNNYSNEYQMVKFFREKYMKQRGFKGFEKFHSALENVYEKEKETNGLKKTAGLLLEVLQ